MKIVELVASLIGALVIAAALAMPLLVPNLGIALLIWVVAFVLVVALGRKLERVSPGAVSKLWSFEMRVVMMGLQVALDLAVPHLGDAFVVVGYVVLITLTLRLGTFPHARVVNRRVPRGPRRFLQYVPMLIVTLPAIWLLVVVVADFFELEVQ